MHQETEVTTRGLTLTQVTAGIYLVTSVLATGAIAAALLVQLSTKTPATKPALTACTPVAVQTPMQLANASTTTRKAITTSFQVVNQKVLDAQAAKLTDAQLIQAAKNRKEYFLKMAALDPASLLKNLSSASVRNRLAGISTNCVEQKEIAEGVVEIQIAEDLIGERDWHFYALKQADGTRLQLFPAKGELKISAGSQIRVQGFKLDDKVVFDATRDIAAVPSASPDDSGYVVQNYRSPSVVQGEQKTLVILGTFANSSTPTGDVSVVNVQEKMQEVNNYFVEVSNQRMNIAALQADGQAADVRGWYNLDIPESCDRNIVVASAIRAADAEIDFSAYYNVIVYAPIETLPCGFSGVASLGGNEQMVTNDGTVSLAMAWIIFKTEFFPMYFMGTTTHEMGHLIGLQHAARLYNRTFPLNDGTDIIGQYGDPYDVMGNVQRHGSFNGPHKEFLGWMQPENSRTVLASGDYTIYPLEFNGGGTQLVKIPRSSNQFITIEYRQPIGVDFDLPVSVYTGGLVHLMNQDNTMTTMLDVDDPTSDESYVLGIGQSVTDPRSGTVIQVLSATSESLQIRVNIGNVDFIPPVFSHNFISGSSISGPFQIMVSATDESQIEKVVVELDGLNILLCEDFSFPYQCTCSLPEDLSDGNYYLRIKVFDRVGNIGIKYVSFLSTQHGDVGLFSDIPNGAYIKNGMPATLLVRGITPLSLPGSSVDMCLMPSSGVVPIYCRYDYDAPFTYTLSTTGISNGYHRVRFSFYDEVFHYWELTRNVVIDTIAPFGSFSYPDPGVVISDNIFTSQVYYEDQFGTEKIEFFKGDEQEPLVTIHIPQDFTYLNLHDFPEGETTLRAKIYDFSGNTRDVETTFRVMYNRPCGDVDASGVTDITDAVFLINYLFGGSSQNPSPYRFGDPDGSGFISVSDAVYLINYIFGGGPAPVCGLQGFVKKAPDMTEGWTLESFKQKYPQAFTSQAEGKPQD
ncbi:MAG: Ig-like domain-containing protein [Patescibacteria group bacterium]